MTLLKTPSVAWPTILLAVAALSLHVVALCLAVLGTIPLAAAAGLVFVAAFAAFTPMHDAAHRSVCRRRGVNDLVGRLASIPLLAPYAAFRFVHLEHHRHTNNPELDPDHYAGRGPWWSLPFRWLSQDLHYYVVVVRNWSTRPRAERLDVALGVALIASMITLLVAFGHGGTFVWAWLIPARLAIGALSFAFDYLPHVPHQTPAAKDRYRATRIIVGPLLTPLFLFQNYHLIHHLYPGVPFYRYKAVFIQRKASLLARGAIVTRWLASR